MNSSVPRSTPQTDLDARIRSARPPVPDSLRGASLRNASTAQCAAPVGSNARPWWIRGGALAAAAAIVLAVWMAPPFAPLAPRAANAFSTALDDVRSVDALRIETSWDRGEGEVAGWSAIVLAGVGYRVDDRAGDFEVYNLEAGRRIRSQNGQAEFVTAEFNDEGMIAELLSRAALDDSFELFMIDTAEAPAKRSQTRGDDGTQVWRYESVDDSGNSVVVELDADAPRLRMTQSWINSHDGGFLRQTVHFSYPSRDEIDPGVVQLPDLAGKLVTPEPVNRLQCMVNVRNLVTAAILYAGEHNDALPPNVDALARYAPGELDALLECTDESGAPVRATYSPPQAAEPMQWKDLDPSHVLFYFEFPDGRVCGFSDGHAEWIARPD